MQGWISALKLNQTERILVQYGCQPSRKRRIIQKKHVEKISYWFLCATIEIWEGRSLAVCLNLNPLLQQQQCYLRLLLKHCLPSSKSNYAIEYLLSIQDEKRSLASCPALQLQSLSLQTNLSPEILIMCK